MGEENNVVSPLNLLAIFKIKDNQLPKMDQEGLNLDLSLGSSHTTQPPPENEVTVQEFTINEIRDVMMYRQALNNYNSGKHFGQEMLARAVCLPPEVEALKLQFAHAPEHSNSDRTASAYHPKANSAVNEIGESAYNLYGIEGNIFPAEKAKVPSLSSGKTFETPIATLQLMKQMPSVKVVGPTGITLEGVLFKFDMEECMMVCLCHACFHSPADFVRHAGWGTVPNPSEHIKILRLGL